MQIRMTREERYAIIERIQKLHSLASSSNENTHEAKSALAKAHQLMTKYGITTVLIKSEEEEKQRSEEIAKATAARQAAEAKQAPTQKPKPVIKKENPYTLQDYQRKAIEALRYGSLFSCQRLLEKAQKDRIQCVELKLLALYLDLRETKVSVANRNYSSINREYLSLITHIRNEGLGRFDGELCLLNGLFFMADEKYAFAKKSLEEASLYFSKTSAEPNSAERELLRLKGLSPGYSNAGISSNEFLIKEFKIKKQTTFINKILVAGMLGLWTAVVILSVSKFL